MESLYLLIPLSVLAVGVAVGVFFWMNHDGQFDDDQGPAWSILLDDDRPEADEKVGSAPADVNLAASEAADRSKIETVEGDSMSASEKSV